MKFLRNLFGIEDQSKLIEEKFNLLPVIPGKPISFNPTFRHSASDNLFEENRLSFTIYVSKKGARVKDFSRSQ